MLGENEKETQLAYQLEDRIIRIQECDRFKGGCS
jgi:hypothetical protein